MAVRNGKPSNRWRRVLEYGIFAWVVLGTLGVISIVAASMAMATPQTTYDGSSAGVAPETGGGLLVEIGGLMFVVLLLYSMLFTILAAVGLYNDASEVRSANVGWRPRPVLYAIGGLLFSGLAVLHYLWKRYEYIPAEPTSPLWGKLALASTIGGLAALVAGFVGPPVALFGLWVFVPTLAIAVYHDAKSMTAYTDWKPNPVTYFVYVLFTGLLLVVPYLIGGYYLYKRQSVA